EYVYAGAKMIASEQGGVLRYYHSDRLSTRLITDASGNVIGTEDHLPFGDDAGVSGVSEKHRFTNYERDSESSTDYAVNRQYATSTGRFMRPDPISGALNNPQSLNRYSYAAGDPLNCADPPGLLMLCFFNIQEVSVRETPENPRGTGYLISFEGCIDLGEGGPSRDPGERGGGGGDKKKQPKKCSEVANLA